MEHHEEINDDQYEAGPVSICFLVILGLIIAAIFIAIIYVLCGDKSVGHNVVMPMTNTPTLKKL